MALLFAVSALLCKHHVCLFHRWRASQRFPVSETGVPRLQGCLKLPGGSGAQHGVLAGPQPKAHCPPGSCPTSDQVFLLCTPVVFSTRNANQTCHVCRDVLIQAGSVSTHRLWQMSYKEQVRTHVNVCNTESQGDASSILSAICIPAHALGGDFCSLRATRINSPGKQLNLFPGDSSLRQEMHH